MNDDMPFGWPLGLSFLNTRLRVAESLPDAPSQPYSLHVPSSSFSSFSSSNLDTEFHCCNKQSSASFFQDNSVSLGRLIGIKAGERGRLYFPNSFKFEERNKIKSLEKNDSEEEEEVGMSKANICIPIILDTLLKNSRTNKKTNSRN